jgi:hypothetical protein
MLQLFLISSGVDPWTPPTVGLLNHLLIIQAKSAMCKNNDNKKEIIDIVHFYS